ncbi:3-hydroxyisobutyrate dehydrogenase [Bathymodiolus japonicus methanotrophic gill symbiont]|uniref:NAD(P)-dependent oxidoreductase n=1 Tax=Bathymodiolus japonicus methanotrophic gill symbiont TaxID=113269 RepID=UPI001B588BD0|nr:NAD(P)-dependent oxidoreductase [Bathymodiolus japonicus methanotrophic gill symbiont]GFO71483.1 3-hydroxyisobutyrate dehydrogenase [Bathymodiolus japonicus methanotrophic gill symbiont]
MQTGIIGLGAMGTGMARNLARSGNLNLLWNRTSATADTLTKELDITAAASIQQLASSVDIIIVCVSADKDLLEVIKAIQQSIRPGSIVIDTSTVSSETATKAAELLAVRQAHLLDAPVSGGVEGAKNGTLAMMVGGDQAILDKVKPVLDSICSRIIYMGPTGSGQGTKAVNQIIAAGINQAVTEALAFAQAEGLPLEKVIDVVSGGAAGNWFLEHRGLSMTRQQYQPGFKLALHHKDLKICQSMAEQNSADLPLVQQTIIDYQQLMNDGFGDEDISALYRLKQKNLA